MAKTFTYIPAPFRGLNKSQPPMRLRNEETPDCKNVIFKDGMAQVRPGYSSMKMNGISGTPTNFTDFLAIGSYKLNMAFTASALQSYWLSVVGDEWSPTSAYRLVASTAASDVKVSGKDILQATADYDDIYTNHTLFYEASLARTVLVQNQYRTNALRGGGLATGAFRLAGPIAYQASARDMVGVLTLSSTDYTGVAGEFIIAKSFESYKNHLILMNTFENDVHYPHRCRFNSNVNNIGRGNWESGDYIDLTQTEGFIQWGMILSNELIVYKEDAIMALTHVGGDLVFADDYYIPDEGLLSPRLLVNVGNSHIFMGTQGIYRYWGGQNLDNIGDPVWNDIQDNMDLVQTSTLVRNYNRGFAYHFKDENLVLFCLPTKGRSGSVDPNEAWVYNYVDKTWTKWAFLHKLKCMADMNHIKFADTNVPVRGRRLRCPVAGFGSKLSAIGGGIAVFTKDKVLDKASAISAYYTTPIIRDRQVEDYIQYDLLDVDARAYSVSGTQANAQLALDMRYDGMSQFSAVQTRTLSMQSTWQGYQFETNQEARDIQFRFRALANDISYQIAGASVRTDNEGSR